MKVEEITDESTRRILLVKTGLDNQLAAVRPSDTALFAANSNANSVVLIQHGGSQTLWQLTGDYRARLAFKKDLEDKLRSMENSTINPGDNVEYFRRVFNLN
jgi:muconolactone delta-isomerase